MRERSEQLEKNGGLVETYYNSMDKVYCYKLFFTDKDKANSIYKKFLENKNIINIKLYNE